MVPTAQRKIGYALSGRVVFVDILAKNVQLLSVCKGVESEIS